MIHSLFLPRTPTHLPFLKITDRLCFSLHLESCVIFIASSFVWHDFLVVILYIMYIMYINVSIFRAVLKKFDNLSCDYMTLGQSIHHEKTAKMPHDSSFLPWIYINKEFHGHNSLHHTS